LKQIFGPLEDILPLHEGKNLCLKNEWRLRFFCNRSSLSFKTQK
jgi:hypothetical protein